MPLRLMIKKDDVDTATDLQSSLPFTPDIAVLQSRGKVVVMLNELTVFS
jgi:hypothetical protein